MSSSSSSSSSSKENKMKCDLIGFGKNFFHCMGSDVTVKTLEQSKSNTTNYYYEIKLKGERSSISSDCTINKISAGDTHVTILTNDGKIHCVGTLNGEVYPNPKLMTVELPIKCIEISSGKRHVLALMEGGMVLSWGSNYCGQLGHEEDAFTKCTNPTRIKRLLPRQLGDVVTHIYAGPYNSMCTTQNSKTFAWGSNNRYQCGIMEDDIIHEPLLVQTHVNFTKIALGRHHSLAISTSGALYSWGTAISGSYYDENSVSPQIVNNLSSVIVQDIAVGDKHSLILSQDGELYTFGKNTDGQLGLGQITKHIFTPRIITFSITTDTTTTTTNRDKVEEIYAAGNSSAALTREGNLYTWGNCDVGHLGKMKFQKDNNLTFVDMMNDKNNTDSTISVEECCTFDSSYNILLPQQVPLDTPVSSFFLGPTYSLLTTSTCQHHSKDDM